MDTAARRGDGRSRVVATGHVHHKRDGEKPTRSAARDGADDRGRLLWRAAFSDYVAYISSYRAGWRVVI